MVGEVSERIVVARAATLPADLTPRIVSGLVLAGVALAANWAGPITFAALVGIVALVMSWEWARVVRQPALDTGLLAQLAAMPIPVAAVALGHPIAGLGALLVGAAVVALLCRPRQPLLSGLGVVYVGLPAMALIWLRNDAAYGQLAILFIYIIVWTTDTFAYTCGKLIGGPKLWPAISPMKTWAGTIGGVCFAALAGLVFACVIAHPAPFGLALIGVLLSTAAQAGDLAESALKRTFAIKHASRLIPGHGGFLDRMDGIVAAAALAALLAALRDPVTPAHALLFWS